MNQTDELKPYLAPAFSRKAVSITALDVSGLTSYTDVLVIITGTSARQVSSISDHIRSSLKEIGKKPIGSEGLREGKWVLLDFGWIIIHIFDEATKELYDLEGLWADAPRIDLREFSSEPLADGGD
ncbi:MAG: ribosome silencing factor [Desulfobacteraceae bacterium]